jgi:hypothetical protein
MEGEFHHYLKKQSQFLNPIMNITSLVTTDYEDKSDWTPGENKANMPAFGWKSEILSPKSETDRMKAERQIPARFTEHDLKKQSQFVPG